MKLKYYKNGVIQTEENLPNGWIAQVYYKKRVNITNINLTDFTNRYEKRIEISPDLYLTVIINDSPLLEPIYKVMDQYKGIEIVHFEYKETKIVFEW